MQNNYYSTATTPQRTLPGYDMNHLYLSPSHQQANRTGIFLKRSEKIDWRRLAAVDVDRIAREMDFQALQDNLEQITLCNIDAEVDARAMDPNFLKLYKMAQLTIEYLLLCQDQITAQLGDYEQIKNRSFHEQDDSRREIEKLKTELAESKKESKKRRKMLETQQRMLMAQNSNYHTCPVCTHAFLSVSYLEAHMARRHPNYDPNKRRERDVDVEKEIQRFKDELNKKENELQLIKVQKAGDEEKIRDREIHIRQLKEEIHTLTTRLTILDDRFSLMKTDGYTRSSSPQRNDSSVSELLKENKHLRAEIEQLKQLLQQAEPDLKKEQKLRRRLENENENLVQEISNLKQNLQLLQATSGNSSRLSEELITYQNRYNEERSLRKKLQDELQQRNPPSQTTDRKSPVPSVRSIDSPVPMRPTRPLQPTEIILSNYCPQLVARLKENPKFLTKYRDEARKQFNDELQDVENLGISETDTRLTDLDFRTKMESVLQTRRNIQDDLPDFERIRADISRTLDRLVNERLDVRRSITSIRSTGSKLVTFEDQKRNKHSTPRTPTEQHRLPSTTVPSKTKYDDSRPGRTNEAGEDRTASNISDSDDERQSPRIGRSVQPVPRKSAPTKGVSALVTSGITPSTKHGESAIAAIARQPIVKPQSTGNQSNSESETEASVPVRTSSVTDKKRIIDQKLQESASKGKKPGISAIAQGFQPTRETLKTQNHDDDDDDDEETDTFTTLHTNPPGKTPNVHLPQISTRDLITNNPLSSGDVSQHTYDSLWKSQASKGAEHRRPLTADSTKTSMMDSDENLDGEESN
ncbi:unnamed protein product [Adineta ricciae]|uniref:C2H2-type domain-containing protein n=1 Tax=Adineta ricciae TaxID=249248 RepID=A0A813SU62_ADIRI|nr:unnamed protein product [Adineta ricciae]CAF0968868.1 unnamed protein product [Adineta ricciae]